MKGKQNNRALRFAMIFLCISGVNSNSIWSQEVGGGPIQVQMAVTHCYSTIADNDSTDEGISGDSYSHNSTENNKTEYRWKTSWRFDNQENIVGDSDCISLNKHSHQSSPGYLDVDDLIIFNHQSDESFDPQLYALGGDSQKFGFWEEDIADNCRSENVLIEGNGIIADHYYPDDYSIFFANEIVFPHLTICNVPPMAGLNSEGRFYSVKISAIGVESQTGAHVSANYSPPAPEGISASHVPCAGLWFSLDIDDSECRNLGGNTWNELYDIEIETSPGSGVFELACDNCSDRPSIIFNEIGTYEVRAYSVSTLNTDVRSISFVSTSVDVGDSNIALVPSCPRDTIVDLGEEVTVEAVGFPTIADGCATTIEFSDIVEDGECSGDITYRKWDFFLSGQLHGTCTQVITRKDISPPFLYISEPEREYVVGGCSPDDFFYEQLAIECNDDIPVRICDTLGYRTIQHPFSQELTDIDQLDFGDLVFQNYKIMFRVFINEYDIQLQYFDTPLDLDHCQTTQRWERTYVATDSCGNESISSLIIRMEEANFPRFLVTDTIYEGTSIQDVKADSDHELYYSGSGRTISEDKFDGTIYNCTSEIIKYTDYSHSDEPLIFRRHWEITNKCGRTTSEDQYITVVDIQAPTFPNGCDAQVFIDASGSMNFENHHILLAEAVDLATDSQDLIYQWDQIKENYNCSDASNVYQVIVTATDISGNTSEACISNLSIYDTIPSTISCYDITIDIEEGGYVMEDFISELSDNCISYEELLASYSLSSNAPPFSDLTCDHLGTLNVSLEAGLDIHGNAMPHCSATVSVIETVAPQISCRDTVIYIDQGNAPLTVSTLPIISLSDNCFSSNELSLTWKQTTSFTCANLGSDEEFWIEATDPYNNSSRCTFTLSVLDTTSVEVTCRDRIIELGSNFNYTLSTGQVYTGLSSLCNSVIDHPGTLAFSPESDPTFDCDDAGIPKEVTLVYTPDDGSPASTCISTVTVYEAFDPHITCPVGIIDVEASYVECGATVDYAYTAWDDECDYVDVDLIEGLPSGSLFPVGWNNVIIQAYDKSGNYTSCSFVVRVNEPSESPAITCPEDFTVDISDDECYALIDTSAYSIESCFVQISQHQGQNMGTSFEIGTHSIGFRALNTSTNQSSTCTFEVTVEKTYQNPTALCQDTTIILAGKKAYINMNFVDAGSYGDCGLNLTRWLDQSSFTCSNLGENTVLLTVRDNGGRLSSCAATVTVLPKEPVCQDITVLLDAEGSATIAPEDVHVTDNVCLGLNIIELDKSTFTCMDLGTNEVTLTRHITLDDDYDKNCQATITVALDPSAEDLVPPIALCIPDTTIYIDHDWDFRLDYTLLDDGSYDIAGCQTNDNISFLLSDEVLFCDEFDPYDYILTVTDQNGNSSTCTTTITLADTLGPEIIYCNDITINLDGNGYYPITFDDVYEILVVNEVCISGGYDFSQMQLQYSCSDLGPALPMTIVALDINGNKSTCDFLVKVTADGVSSEVCPCANSQKIVTSIANDGPGSLRAVLQDGCVGDSIFFHQDLMDQEITLTSTIEVIGDKHIFGLGMDHSMIQGQDIHCLLSIPEGVNVSIMDTKIMYNNPENLDGAILNNGNLDLYNVIFEKTNQQAIGSPITNKGTIIILSDGEVKIK